MYSHVRVELTKDVFARYEVIWVFMFTRVTFVVVTRIGSDIILLCFYVDYSLLFLLARRFVGLRRMPN